MTPADIFLLVLPCVLAFFFGIFVVHYRHADRSCLRAFDGWKESQDHWKDSIDRANKAESLAAKRLDRLKRFGLQEEE